MIDHLSPKSYVDKWMGNERGGGEWETGQAPAAVPKSLYLSDSIRANNTD